MQGEKASLKTNPHKASHTCVGVWVEGLKTSRCVGISQNRRIAMAGGPQNFLPAVSGKGQKQGVYKGPQKHRGDVFLGADWPPPPFLSTRKYCKGLGQEVHC